MTQLTRRGFIEAAAATSAGAAALWTGGFSSAWAAAARTAPRGKPVAESLGNRLALITGGGGNVLALGSDDGGALLVDGGNAAASAAVLKLALGAVDAKQVRTLFNTHWHPDQTGSNAALGKQGAQIIAQENTRLWLTRKINADWLPQPHPAFPKQAQPNKTFYTTDKLDFGGEQLAFGHLGQAHTDGDIHVYLPKANVLAAGGVVSSQGWPLLDWQTGGWIGGLVGAYDRLMKVANDSTRVIPANGPVIGVAELKEYREMYFAIFDRCVALLIKGMSPDEAVAEKPAKEFEEKWGESGEFVRAAFKSLWGHYAPDA
ncbi:MAG: MBL fold metallo-hydrolase [Nevskiaceae bacterium]|jgi:glyoxylase-like metal-dependent hydrolase (beta-lactamase superfamily II)|nr:MBL fold metallo-hydrolase [Nevskiaceae bacterium]